MSVTKVLKIGIRDGKKHNVDGDEDGDDGDDVGGDVGG